MAKETGEEQERETVCGERGEGSKEPATAEFCRLQRFVQNYAPYRLSEEIARKLAETGSMARILFDLGRAWELAETARRFALANLNGAPLSELARRVAEGVSRG